MRPVPQPAQRALSDGALVVAARTGDVASLGLLLERHRPRLLATALRLLGYRADADDAVQEAFLIAVRHLGAVREPDAVGAWLQAVVRRCCLHHRRRRPGAELRADRLPEVVDERPGPEERIERLELRDWVWGALQRLPEPLRLSATLRYFGSYDSYEEVAAILGVPVGTVRSRLSEARARLADALLQSAGLVDDDSRLRATERERFWTEAFGEILRRGDSGGFVSRFTPDLHVGWSNGKVARGREHLASEIDGDLEAGVRLDVVRVIPNDGVAVVEARFVNPPESPDHCPPGIALVVFEEADTASRIRLHLSPRPPRAEEE